MARKSNFPNAQEPDIEPDQLSLMVANMAELQKMQPVQTDDEVEERLQFFFDWCSRKQLRPTVSLMCLCLGHPRQTLWKWQQRGDRRGALIDRGKAVIEALTEQWMTCGRINPVSGIFILKANFGWRETVTIETVPRQDLAPHMTPDEIDAYLADIDKRIPDFRAEEEQRQQRMIEQDIPVDD